MISDTPVELGTDGSDPADPEPQALEVDETAENMVKTLQSSPEGIKYLRELLAEVHEEFMASWEANAKYRERNAQSLKILYCDLPRKDKPYENCANVAIPLALQNVVRYTNKIFGEVFGDWSGVFNFIPTNPESEAIAPIVTEHSNWQIRNRFPDFKRQMHRALLLFAMTGDVVCHSYWDPVAKRNRHEVLTSDDFIAPYTHVSTSPDFSDVPWIARRMPFFKSRLRAMKKMGWENVDDVLADSPPQYGESEIETPLRESVSKLLGEEPEERSANEYEIIHYEGYLLLPGQDDERYCQLVYDPHTMTPLKLSIHEEVSHAEQYRLDWQKREKAEYQQAMQAYEAQQQKLVAQQAELAHLLASTPYGHPEDPQMGQMNDQLLQQQQQMLPPERPDWMKSDDSEPKTAEKSPIHMFSHGVCLEPLLGNMGVGIGLIDTQLNIGENTVWSQFIDAATLGNGKTFITAGNVDFRSPFRIGPGVINKAKNVMPSDLQNAFYELNFGQANPQLMQAAQALMTFGEQASGTPDVMSGAAGKSGETARGIQARIEQMNTMIAVPAQKFADVVVQIAKNNCKLNRLFMRDEEIFYVNRFNEDLEQNGSKMIKAAREMYDNEYEIELVSDLQFKSRAQRVSEADEMVQLPNALQEMQADMAFKYQAVKQSLKARGMHRMARTLLGPPPPLPQNTFGLPPGTPGTAQPAPPPPPPGVMPPGGAPPGAPGAPPRPPQAGPTPGQAPAPGSHQPSPPAPKGQPSPPAKPKPAPMPTPKGAQ